MPKYIVKGTNILHNKVVYAEGKEIELKKEEAERLADYLELIRGSEKETATQGAASQVKPEKETENQSKSAKEAKTQTKPTKEVTGGDK